MKIVVDENIPFVVECFSSIGQVVALSGRKITPDIVADADALIVRSITRVDTNLLTNSKVSFVGTATIGFDHIDIDFLQKRNIGFASAPGSNANSAAEYVIAALLEIAKKHNINLEDKSIGVIGVGNVGSRAAKKASALGMRLKLNDPPLQRKTNDPKYLPIEELFDCDFITMHTPLTFQGEDKTFHLADEKFFKSLKDGSIFLNTSRGGVVETDALKTVTKTGLLKAVVLDVWENEPSIDTELLQIVDIGTPHIAGYSLDGKINGMIMIYKAVCEYFGIEPEFNVDSFLPKPAIAELKISLAGGNEQDALHSAVQKIYNISEDDHKLRGIVKEKEEKMGEFFDNLRKNYHVRREFKNTKVTVDNKNSSLAKKLEGIGFLHRKASPGGLSQE